MDIKSTANPPPERSTGVIKSDDPPVPGLPDSACHRGDSMLRPDLMMVKDFPDKP